VKKSKRRTLLPLNCWVWVQQQSVDGLLVPDSFSEYNRLRKNLLGRY